MVSGWVFGYGSLTDAARRPAWLPGWRRRWGVAMDNAVEVAGYKRYETPAGARPAVHVCFLDLVPELGAVVNGALVPVDAEALAGLDARERNYDRVEVTDRVVVDRADGVVGSIVQPVFTYLGSSAGRARFAAGVGAGTAVIDRAYRDGVLAAFAALGPDQLAAARPSLDPGPLPVRELIRRPT